ncbi:hypothetical protein GDO86_013870 [Hymenochirus boettgeri]|uniref:phosphatidate phosphatase n=1 Tax=Hymenochirus boettgeri TaxID=247094 RepID=A0A8T2JQU6_9PIPI|nr:hypothetical protein GDO86_013870 [Hymenochirus boettgeri]
MNYVGQLAGSVLGRVKELYSGVNPATLSGAIDVVVVRQPDGSFLSSPFHVRFGKLGVLRSAEITVDIEVNGEPVDLQMKLGENGEAFFIQETDRSEIKDVESFTINTAMVPDTQNSGNVESFNTATVPDTQNSSPTESDITTKRRQWLNRRIRKIVGEGFKETKDLQDMLPVCDSIYFSMLNTAEDSSFDLSKEPFQLPEDHSSSRTPSPKSDSELEIKPANPISTEQHMEWDWGRLPQVNLSEVGPQKTQSAPPSPTSRDGPPLPPDLDEREELLKEKIDEYPRFDGQQDHRKDFSADPSISDDILSPDSQEVSLYFQNSEPYPLLPSAQGKRRADGESSEDQHQETCVSLSLCGGLAETWDIPHDWFQKHRISYSEFCNNPAIIEDPRLVLRIHNKYYNWAAAAPIILCMQVFQQDLPQGVINQLEQQKMPRNQGWWFSWRRRDTQLPMYKPQECEEQKESNPNSLKEFVGEKTEDSPMVPAIPSTYQRSLRLTSEQIKCLNLHSGANDVVFSVCTKFQGTCRSRAQIFLWDCKDRVIISDIDGTVTKSDALGHILPQLGKDWTQPGIVHLYHAIHMNGYNFMYCSARSVGLAELTKGFLQGVSDKGCRLPLGPLLLSPSSLFTALHREVIERNPEHFKISCLSDIRQLFPDSEPFYAAFGNRPNDAVAYKKVGVPESRIFTVNKKGELTQELNLDFKSSYLALSELANVMFPPTMCLSPEFGDLSFWRDLLPSVSEEELDHVS